MPPPHCHNRHVMNQTLRACFTLGDSSVVEAWWQFYGLRAEEDILGCSRSLFVFISHPPWWQSRIESCSLQPGCKKPGKCARARDDICFFWLIIRPNLASAASWTKRRRDFTAIKLGQCFLCHCSATISAPLLALHLSSYPPTSSHCQSYCYHAPPGSK